MPFPYRSYYSLHGIEAVFVGSFPAQPAGLWYWQVLRERLLAHPAVTSDWFHRLVLLDYGRGSTTRRVLTYGTRCRLVSETPKKLAPCSWRPKRGRRCPTAETLRQKAEVRHETSDWSVTRGCTDILWLRVLSFLQKRRHCCNLQGPCSR